VHFELSWDGSCGRNELKFSASWLATNKNTPPPSKKKKILKRQEGKKVFMLHMDRERLRVSTNSSLHNKLGSQIINNIAQHLLL